MIPAIAAGVAAIGGAIGKGIDARREKKQFERAQLIAAGGVAAAVVLAVIVLGFRTRIAKWFR